MKRIEMVGERFGRLTVMGDSDKGDKCHRYVLCKCDCGNLTEVSISSLRSGLTKSCGCLHQEEFHKIVTKHGHYGERLYPVWKQMKQRCSNTRNKSYEWYGARGIKVCDEWQDYGVFRSWALSSGYKEGLTIDRINGNGNYEPDNCRWITIQEQQKNRRPPRKRKD